MAGGFPDPTAAFTRAEKAFDEFMMVHELYNSLAGGLAMEFPDPSIAFAYAVEELFIEAKSDYDDARNMCKFKVARCEEIYAAHSSALSAHQTLLEEVRILFSDKPRHNDLLPPFGGESFDQSANLLDASRKRCVELEKTRGEAEVEEHDARTFAAKARSNYMEVSNMYSDWMCRELKSC